MASSERSMLVGSSRVDITPKVGSPLAGYSNRSSFSTGIHDDLHARTLIMDDGEERAGVVSCDLIGVLPEMTERARGLARDIGIPDGNLMVCAFHTHSGPTPDLGYGDMDDYMDRLSAKLAQSVEEAASTLEPAESGIYRAEAAGLTINRRHPQGGPVDPELIALSWKGTGGYLAHLINFSCHAVVLGWDSTLISADYPGYAMRMIEERTGAMCLFTNGACGDINPLTEGLRRRMMEGGDIYDRSGGRFGEASLLGHHLARIVLDNMDDVERSPASIDCRTHTFEAHAHPPGGKGEVEGRISELESALPRMEREGAPADELYRTGLELSFLRRTLAALERGSVPVELQGIRIGDAVLLGIPGEVFVEIGLRIKEKARSLGLTALVVELANDYLSYLPTETAFREGGYEVEIARSLGYGPEIGDQIVSGAGALLEDLDRGF